MPVLFQKILDNVKILYYFEFENEFEPLYYTQ